MRYSQAQWQFTERHFYEHHRTSATITIIIIDGNSDSSLV